MAKWYDWLVKRALLSVELTEKEILELEIAEHLKSPQFKMMVAGQEYYKNKTDVLNKQQSVDWKQNSRIGLGLFRKLVDQKVGYLLSKEPTVAYGDDADVSTKEVLDDVFDEMFLRILKSVGREAVVKGVGYAMPYIDENGRFNIAKIPSQQVIPFYSDERRTKLDAFLRVYNQVVYKLNGKTFEQHVEYWTTDGVEYFKLSNGKLVPNPAYDGIQSHLYYMDGSGEVKGINWDTVPLIPFRYNEDEQSLLEQVKPLIDNLELQTSINADLLADIPKFIYVLKNYGGSDLKDFERNLNLYKAVKVESDGGVDKLQAEINTTAVESELKRSRKALYEAGRAIDTQDENLGNASGQALKWRYTDLDLDCNDFENEMQYSLRQLMQFIVKWAKDSQGVDIDLAKFSYKFNRDVIVNESEAIEDAQKSAGILDERTIRENHPWYIPEVEQRLLEEQEQKQEQVNDYLELGHEHEGDDHEEEQR